MFKYRWIYLKISDHIDRIITAESYKPPWISHCSSMFSIFIQNCSNIPLMKCNYYFVTVLSACTAIALMLDFINRFCIFETDSRVYIYADHCCIVCVMNELHLCETENGKVHVAFILI